MPVAKDAALQIPAQEPSCGWQLEVRWLRFADLGAAWDEVVRKLGGWVPAAQDLIYMAE